ncbi:hypothetical protein KR51_00037090 [Rubidibacter lacunae KORDI 51-2]|uniref:Uncharacterized protein n=1 Tax=Rubidibacter lacunae KORDI 51-2 TaxID=582515 RepID=U5DGZ3_9CHRO|nr:hypothetical protein KR51_00037090 [Rubidibacter lacunae KORDI 51-2]
MPQIALAAVDRLLHDATIIDIQVESFRKQAPITRT